MTKSQCTFKQNTEGQAPSEPEVVRLWEPAENVKPEALLVALHKKTYLVQKGAHKMIWVGYESQVLEQLKTEGLKYAELIEDVTVFES